MSKNSLIFIIFFAIYSFGSPLYSYSQTDSLTIEDTEIIQRKWDNLPFFLDDFMLVGGLNRGGIWSSNNFRELGYAKGFNFGLEGFIPLGNVTFFNYGVQFSKRKFIHEPQDILFSNNYLDAPLYVSFRLPEFTSIDLRLFLGTQISYRLSSKQSKPYSMTNSGEFQYDPLGFKRVDGGMTFGLSGEHNNFFGRLRSYVGVNNLDKNEQGAYNSFFIEMGYFLFRGYRK